MTRLLPLAALLLLSFRTVDAPLTETAKASNLFAFDLYQQMSAGSGNTFISPYSISSAMALVYAGATLNSTTAREIASTMHYAGEPTSFHQHFGSLMQTLNSRNNEDITIHSANRLFGDNTLVLVPDYLKLLNNRYNASLEKLNFQKNPEPSRVHINSWVEQKTKNRIKDLVPKGMINNATKLVLVNAIYFYADWLHQFDSNRTHQADFYINGINPVKTKAMNQLETFEYMETNKMQGIRLPYKGNKLSMEIWLPKQKEGISELEQQITETNINKWESGFKYQRVQLFLPKFTMTYSMMMNETLQKMGINEAFSDAARFGGISTQTALKIDKVIHKTFIEVSEKGTEAAAATAIMMVETTSAAPRHEEPPKVFKADHPFVFTIRDNETGTILFMGRVMNPTEK